MSAFELYHKQGIRQYRVTDIARKKDHKIVIKGIRRTDSLRCPICGSKNVSTKGWKERVFIGVPSGNLKTEIHLMIPRVNCHHCGSCRQVHLEFAEENVRYTRFFAQYAKKLLTHCTCKAAAEILRVSWDTIKEIDKKDLQKHYADPPLKKVKNIAIDEIAVKKGHKYMTVIVDLDTMTPLYVGDGRGKEAVKGFYEKVRKSKCKIKSVAIDMSPAFTQAVKEYFPKAILVYDHFHIIKQMNEAITSCRRTIYKEATDSEAKNAIKKTRFILLKHKENLDPSKNEPQRLEKALRLNDRLSKMYYLKEDLYQLWSQPDKQSARKFAEDWLKYARELKIEALTYFCTTLETHLENILTWYDVPISTGPLEGLNNKIKTMKRQAYGFRDEEYFRLKILGIKRCRYALVG